MTNHAVVIAGGGPTGLMLAGELALAGVDVAIVELRAGQDLMGSRAGGLHSRTIEVLDQRGIADRFLSEGQMAQVAGFAGIRLDISDFPTRHNYGLALWQNHIERILAGWVGELAVPIYRGREVTGFAQDDTGVDVALSDGRTMRTQYLVGCDGGRSLVRKSAGIDFPGSDPTTSNLIAEVEMAETPEWGIHRSAFGVHSFGRKAYQIVDGKSTHLRRARVGRNGHWRRLRTGSIGCNCCERCRRRFAGAPDQLGHPGGHHRSLLQFSRYHSPGGTRAPVSPRAATPAGEDPPALRQYSSASSR